MQPVPQDLLKQYVQSQKFTSTTEIMPEVTAWQNRPLEHVYTLHPERGSKLEDAVRYSLNQKQQLMAFLDHGDAPISNNLAENAIRPFVVGGKN